MLIDGLEFDRTCAACPEQYDVTKDGKQVGYVRLRWGCLTCDYPDQTGEEIFSHRFKDDLKGIMSPNEQDMFLHLCAHAINERLDAEERSTFLERVLLYDEEYAEGLECSKCGWSSVWDWSGDMPDVCPGCEREVLPYVLSL